MKTNGIPQYFCMRGSCKRYDEIKEIFEKRKCNVREFGFKYENMIYFDLNGNVHVINESNIFYELFISTQTITNLPPVIED